MNFLNGCYNIFRIKTQLWQPLEKYFSIWNSFSPCNFQNWNDFPSLSYTIISQLKWKIISLMWIFPEHFITRTVLFFKKTSAKSSPACLFASTIDMVATLSARHLPTALSYFTQGNWFWNWLLKTMGKIDLDFKWTISLRKQIFIIKIALPQSIFKSSVSLLNA